MSQENNKIDSLADNVAEERARIDETVKQIQHKLTPGQLIDEVWQHGGEPTRNALAAVGKSISAHPIPALLMGAGLLWLAIERSSSGKDQPVHRP